MQSGLPPSFMAVIAHYARAAALLAFIVFVFFTLAAASLAFIAFGGPIAGAAMQALLLGTTERYGIGAGCAVLLSLLFICGYVALRLERRDQRLQYERTRMITVEKRKPTPLWVRIVLTIQGVLLVLAVVGITLESL